MLLCLLIAIPSQGSEVVRDLLVIKKEAAPFSGVLVPESNYRRYRAALDSFELVKTQYDDCEQSRDSDFGFWSGLALGSLAVAAGGLFLSH